MLRKSQEITFNHLYKLAVAQDEQTLLHLIADGVKLEEAEDAKGTLLEQLVFAGEHDAVRFLVRRLGVEADDAVMRYAALNDVTHVNEYLSEAVDKSLFEAAAIGYGISNDVAKISVLLSLDPKLATPVIYGLGMGGHDHSLKVMVSKNKNLAEMAVSGMIAGGHLALAVSYFSSEISDDFIIFVFSNHSAQHYSTLLDIECALSCLEKEHFPLRKKLALAGLQKLAGESATEEDADQLCDRVDHVIEVMEKYGLEYHQAQALTQKSAVYAVLQFMRQIATMCHNSNDVSKIIFSYVLGVSTQDLQIMQEALQLHFLTPKAVEEQKPVRIGLFASSDSISADEECVLQLSRLSGLNN